MARMTRLSLTVLALLLPSVWATAACATPRSVVVENRLEVSVETIAARRSGGEDWSDDLLGEATIAPGRSRTVRIGETDPACRYDLELSLGDRRRVHASSLDLCRVRRLRIDGRFLAASQVEQPRSAKKKKGGGGRYQARRNYRRSASDDGPSAAPGDAVMPGSRAAEEPSPPPVRSEGPEPASPIVEPAPVVAPAPLEIGDSRVVEFLFATSRRPAEGAKLAFGGERSDTLDLGAARVRVPEDHKIGNLEIPAERRIFWISFSREDADPQRHFIVTGLERLDREAWTRLAAAKAGGGDALVFVHGFNTSFEEALLRNAQIVWDLQYKGASVMFSWPSQGGTLAYVYDQNSALGARDRFIELLALLTRDAGIRRVHVLAHSMGNLLVLDALANHARTADPMRIAELIMAAPDIDQAHYRQIGGDLARVAAGLTLYASSADKAMVVSRKLAMAPRAGDVFGGRPVLVPGIEAIDVTAIGDEMFGLNHNMFAATRALIDDIGLIIGSGLRPPQTRLRQIRIMPEGANAPLFWRYAP